MITNSNKGQTKYEQVSRGATTLLRTNKKKARTIEDEQKGKKRGAVAISDFEKMKEKRSGKRYW